MGIFYHLHEVQGLRIPWTVANMPKLPIGRSGSGHLKSSNQYMVSSEYPQTTTNEAVYVGITVVNGSNMNLSYMYNLCVNIYFCLFNICVNLDHC